MISWRINISVNYKILSAHFFLESQLALFFEKQLLESRKETIFDCLALSGILRVFSCKTAE